MVGQTTISGFVRQGEYREKVNDESSLFDKTKVLIELQEKHFHELKEAILTEELIDESYKYLTEVE